MNDSDENYERQVNVAEQLSELRVLLTSNRTLNLSEFRMKSQEFYTRYEHVNTWKHNPNRLN